MNDIKRKGMTETPDGANQLFEDFFKTKDLATINKATALVPMSVQDLFRQVYGNRLDKYKIDPREYIRLISVEISRLYYEVGVARAGIKAKNKKIEDLSQTTFVHDNSWQNKPDAT